MLLSGWHCYKELHHKITCSCCLFTTEVQTRLLFPVAWTVPFYFVHPCNKPWVYCIQIPGVQTSLHICAVWSAPLLFGTVIGKYKNKTYYVWGFNILTYLYSWVDCHWVESYSEKKKTGFLAKRPTYWSQNIKIKFASIWENLSSGFLKKRDSNQPHQLQKR